MFILDILAIDIMGAILVLKFIIRFQYLLSFINCSRLSHLVLYLEISSYLDSSVPGGLRGEIVPLTFLVLLVLLDPGPDAISPPSLYFLSFFVQLR